MVVVGPTTPLSSPSEISRGVLRTIGTKVRWLGPVTGPDAFNCSMLNETGAIIALSPSPATCSGDEFLAERAFRLLRIRIGHPLTEEHQPVLLFTSSAPDPWLRDSNTSFNRLAPLAAVSSPPTSHFLLLQLLGFVTEEPLVPRSVISAAWSF